MSHISDCCTRNHSTVLRVSRKQSSDDLNSWPDVQGEVNKKKKKTGKCRTLVTVVHGNLRNMTAHFSAVMVARGLQKLSFLKKSHGLFRTVSPSSYFDNGTYRLIMKQGDAHACTHAHTHTCILIQVCVCNAINSNYLYCSIWNGVVK